MCHAARCRTCGKTTWRGCGRHVAHVKARVPADQWCPGHDPAERSSGRPSEHRWWRRG
ncbi:hypothetical protein [Nocardioides sp.]|uniref:hypothetical protein n=1 Tax=Nocardioides sp. TaxID=35761 RepID=UPI001A184887|nr:hypothetical protein [Nocardioides sp.]MBJ7355892.1 hypothetical protein [Nocardioides sp.]